MNWSSRATFVLAATGAAVGLGNIWKFPYLTGTSGGGAFVLVYLLAVITIAAPILIAELIVGRRGGASPPRAAANVAAEHSISPWWAAAGWLGVIAGTLILSYYSVIAGWVLAYVGKAASGALATDAASSKAAYATLTQSMGTSTLLHGVFMAACAWVIARGLAGGLELVARTLMPMLFVLLLVMVGYAAVAGDFAAGAAFFLTPDFSALTPSIILTAVGQAFFSVGVSMGIMMAYAAYLPQSFSLGSTAIVIAFADTLVAFLAGFAIFPLVFEAGLDPAGGPGLIFETLPIAFASMPAGNLFGVVFFSLLAVAALTSAIALLEPAVAWVSERGSLSRPMASAILGALLWVVGLASVASFGPLADFHPIGGPFASFTIYALIDWFTASVLMPIGALLIALLVAWRMPVARLTDELPEVAGWVTNAWLQLMRYAVPLAIAAIFVTGVVPS